MDSEREARNFIRGRNDSEIGAWPVPEKVNLSGKRQVDKKTVYFSVLEALAHVWSSTVEQVIAASDFTRKKYAVGKRGKRVFRTEADVLRNPKG